MVVHREFDLAVLRVDDDARPRPEVEEVVVLHVEVNDSGGIAVVLRCLGVGGSVACFDEGQFGLAHVVSVWLGEGTIPRSSLA